MNTLPESFLESIRKTLGTETDLFLKSLDEKAPVSVRLHSKKRAGLFESDRQIPWCKDGRYLKKRPVFTLDPLFHAGCYYVQEAGSMLIENLTAGIIAGLEGAKILDLCASPGGKTTHLLNLLPESCIFVSNEIVPGRNNVLRHNISKWGYSNVIVLQNETRQIAASGEKFDLIITDVPCSGEGLFRKDPASINEWSLQQVERCAIRQRAILNEVVPMLNKGGYLLYSTCTYEPSENDEQIEYLLHHFPFTNVTPPPPHGISQTKHGWQAYPHKTENEGFYCCLLKFEDISDPKKLLVQKVKQLFSLNKEDWLMAPENFQLFQQEDYINAAMPELISTMIHLKKTCYIRQSGIPMGQLKGKDFIPSTELSMSLALKKTLPVIELNTKEAISYLRCESIQSDTPHQGIHLIQYKGFPLGWAKRIQQRWNNYFPKEWRIHMKNNE